MAGSSSRQIAGSLGMSEYTVQDHLKRIFAKFEVNSRAELLAKLFFTHYAPHHGTARPAAGGHYLPT
jgi:DNA-binding CsgD family transcriptional regulator